MNKIGLYFINIILIIHVHYAYYNVYQKKFKLNNMLNMMQTDEKNSYKPILISLEGNIGSGIYILYIHFNNYIFPSINF